MNGPLRIGVIGGGGWLGGFIVNALLQSGLVQQEDLTLSGRGVLPACFSSCRWTLDNQALVEVSDIIIVSVRPADWSGVKINAANKLLISVMAGVRLETLCDQSGAKRVVRAMPNAAAEVCKSHTPWIATDAVSEADRTIVRAIFEACGAQHETGSEAEMDYFTGLTGAGPAFPALLAEAMMNDAVARGLDREAMRRAVNMIIIGAGRLLEQRDDCPAATVAAFLDHRGATAAAIEAMRAAGFADVVSRGLSVAFGQSARMGGAA